MLSLLKIPISAITDGNGVVTSVWLMWFNSVFRFLSKSPTISTGILPPTLTPDKIGDTFVDTVARKVYISVGVASSADWEVMN